MFDIMIWAGVAMSLAGLVGLVWCIFRVARARRAKLSDDDLRAVLKSVLPINLGALGLSILGLMLVGLGSALG
ncbi:hypothetical protein [Antarcticimicrobium sediminis]|uniref:Uncharacterized protein n=1 Tax=Antarcticimicrobium sediminis TaxID=2546227 RepID=A0A4R5ETH9_9RHOB|nr:hypothetical protein [Antarcticimicrobium sediminis]MDX2484042.1 hypothetical protein [Pseudodonghicola sp.]TDE38040.1 hypothetical protein E1B25_11490 [Antarcticimicrobium sediminis]